MLRLCSLIEADGQIVRRLSLASLNAAIQNKPHLIVDRLASLQPLLYQETIINKSLQRVVVMGPFKRERAVLLGWIHLTRRYRGRRAGEPQNGVRDDVSDLFLHWEHN